MYWQEKTEDSVGYKVPEDVIDVVFKIRCKMVPIDHAQVLSDEVIRVLPWMLDENCAIHLIHVADSAHGWECPKGEGESIHTSRRTKFKLRIPSHRFNDAQKIVGKTLNIAGNDLTVLEGVKKTLSKMTTIFARYIDTQGEEEEEPFLNRMNKELLAKGIKVKKMMPGLIVKHQLKDGVRLTRKLMLSELEVEESVLLQETGIGSDLQYGFGIFLPHKGIEAVNKTQE
ncbi:MAG: type I-MYXAN CRISPR-associated protein Cas6/Cmx6 [Gammaproteobacteria bacterium]|nr:type I-MYXAN CRISPR-associated protein Cas6/Cmx6 [Gammaproteobacteria bacterium]